MISIVSSRARIAALVLGAALSLAAAAVASPQDPGGAADAIAPPEAPERAPHPLAFWVGAWDVYARDGKRVGTNTLTFQSDGAVVHESWTSARGSTGVSINFVDRVENALVQVWVSEANDVLRMSAPLDDGSVTESRVRFEGAYHLRNRWTKPHVTELTLLEGRYVRQHIREPNGPEGLWQDAFDALYVPRGESIPDWWPDALPTGPEAGATDVE